MRSDYARRVGPCSRPRSVTMTRLHVWTVGVQAATTKPRLRRSTSWPERLDGSDQSCPDRSLAVLDTAHQHNTWNAHVTRFFRALSE